MRGQTRISSPAGRPLERTRAVARALWESLIRSRRIRAPPGPTRVAARQDVRRLDAV
jgi:hypothetical protein